jgi:hypothetical protein
VGFIFGVRTPGASPLIREAFGGWWNCLTPQRYSRRSVRRSSWDRIAHACRGHSRGVVDVKGKGEMEMYLVEGLR